MKVIIEKHFKRPDLTYALIATTYKPVSKLRQERQLVCKLCQQ
jgi:hypothetical protein